MISDLRPYAEYKESGLPWLGRVPGHWGVRRLRASITDCVNGVWGAEPNGEDDLICVRVADFDRVGLRVSLRKKTVRAIPMSARSRRVLQPGDLLLEKSGGGDLQPVGAVVAYDHDEPAVCSNFVARMPIAAGYDPFFVNYLHFTLYANRVNIRSIKQTTGIQNLDGKAYLSELVAFPPPTEQASIVRFLDWAKGRLERAIRAKRKVIALLNEQKQAIIHRAVTRGLDPSVPLTPSGIPWLGDIPQHWEVVPLSAVTTVVDPNPSHRNPTYTDGGFPFISTVEFVGDEDILLDTSRRVAETTVLEQERRCAFREGSIAFSRKGTIGATRVLPCTVRFALLDSVCVINCRERMRYRYLFRQLGSGVVTVQLGLLARGAALKQVSVGRVRNTRILLPPVEEQEEIETYLEGEVPKVRAVISRLEREIELLREYRTRLVADVVTGKLDVREAAARLPDEAPLDTVEDDADLGDEAEASGEEAAA